MEDQMAMLRREKQSMTTVEWMQEAKMYAEEILDEDALQVLQRSSNRNSIYRSMATVGRAAYEEQLKTIERQKLTGMDEIIAMETAADYKTEAMRSVLAEKMEALIPGFREQYL